MVGFLLGALCGALELYLLTKLIAAVQGGKSAYVGLIAMLKMLVLAAAFVPTILFFRNDLLWCAIGVTAVLVAGAFIRFLLQSRKAK